MSERNLKETLYQILHQHHLLSVGNILKNLEDSGKNYNKTSVYRSLEQLMEEGTVCRHYFDEAQAFYELRADHHSHLVCTNCGKVTETECTYHQPSKIGDFTVDHHHLTLMGVCGECMVKQS